MSKEYDLIADLERSYGKDSIIYKSMSKSLKSNKDVEKLIRDNILNLREALEYDNNFFAKALAAYIRCHMESFHSKYLSDEQMAEQNPIIRNAIFTMLEDFYEEKLMKISGVLRLNLPDYWEDCVYLSD